MTIYFNNIRNYIFKNKNTLLIISVLFLLTFSVRVFLMLDIFKHPANPGLININGEVARNIIDHKGLVINDDNLQLISQKEKQENRLINPEEIVSSSVTSYYQPFYDNEIGYPIFLSLVWKLTRRKEYVFPILFQIILAGLASICVFQMARKFMPLGFAFLSALLYSFYIPEAKLNVLPFQYAWIGLIAVFSTWLIIKIKTVKNAKLIYFLSILLGLFYGIGASMRSTLIFLPLVSIIVFFTSFQFKRALKLSLLILVFFGLIISFYYLYNSSQFNEGRIVRRTFWHSIAVGLGQFPNPWGFLPIDGSIGDFVGDNNPDLLNPTYPNVRSEQFLKEKIINEISKNPMWYIGTVIERIPIAIFPFHWAMINGSIQSKYENSQRIFYLVPYNQKVLLDTFILSLWIALALVGMYFMRKQWILILPLLGTWLYFIGVHSLIFVQPGYIYPVGFIYAIFSACALYKLKAVWGKKFNLSR